MSEYNQPVPNHKTMNFKSILRVISLSHIYFVDPLNWLKLLSILSHSNKFWQFYFVLQTILGTKGSIFKNDIYFCPTLLWTLRIKSISCLAVLTLNLIFWQCAVIRKTFLFVVLADRKVVGLVEHLLNSTVEHSQAEELGLSTSPPALTEQLWKLMFA